MKAADLISALASVPGVERDGDGVFLLGAEREGTFYFGEEGERVTVARVRELRTGGALLELVCQGERAYFPYEELIGFKVQVDERADSHHGAGFRR